MTDPTEMERRKRAVETIAESVRTVYAGKPSSKKFEGKRISASALVGNTAEETARVLIEAHKLLASGGEIPMEGSYWQFWGDMASQRVLEGPEVNVDGAEFWVTIDLDDGWIVSAHPDGSKVVKIDGIKYVGFIEQKNWQNTDSKKRIIALRQAALYLAMARARVRQTGGYLFDADPNYTRPCRPFGWTGDIQPAGIVRSICGPTPPGEVFAVPFTDQELDDHLVKMTEKARHIKVAVETWDIDYARKWDSEHRDEFGGPTDVPEVNEAKEMIAEYKRVSAAIDELEKRKKELRPHLVLLAEANERKRFEADGFTVKLIEKTSAASFDKKLMESDGVLERYMKPGKSYTELRVTVPGLTEETPVAEVTT